MSLSTQRNNLAPENQLEKNNDIGILNTTNYFDSSLNSRNTLTSINRSSSTAVTAKSDLVIQNATTPTSAKAGSTIQLTYSEKNIGNANAGSHRIDFYLSKDASFSSDDTLLGYNSVNSLGAGASISQSKSVTFSSSLASGNYYLLYMGDSLKKVAESNETNNVVAKAISITRSAKSDLVIQNATTPTSAKAGSTIQLTYSEKNIGNANAGSHRIDFYLSKDASFSSDDTLLGYNSVNSLGAGASISQSKSVTFSSSLASGNYYLLYMGDSLKKVAESNETNNVVAKAISIINGSGGGYSSSTGYGLINASAAVAKALGQKTFSDVPNLGGNNWGADLVKAPEVWAKGYTGKGVVVAVLDTGVDRNHVDLSANIWKNSLEIVGNGKDDDGNGYIDDVYGWNFNNNNNNTLDVHGHGTHVSGTIAGVKNNIGVTGIAYDAKIMPVKVLGDSGSGSYSSIVNGIYYAVKNGADVINLSLGGGSGTAELQAAVKYASSKGVIVVMAAGNNGQGQPGYPAKYATQWGFAVGAVDKNNQLASFSNRAGTTQLAYVTAPGVGVYSTLPGNNYASYSGTSMATPHVVGVIALMLSANSNLTDAQVRQIVTSTAQNSSASVGSNFVSSLNNGGNSALSNWINSYKPANSSASTNSINVSADSYDSFVDSSFAFNFVRYYQTSLDNSNYNSIVAEYEDTEVTNKVNKLKKLLNDDQ